MSGFDEKIVQETAYYIWKNNGCPANSCSNDWNAAVEMLEMKNALAMAGKVSGLYKNASLTPEAKMKAIKAMTKNIKATPYILAEAAPRILINASMSKAAKKSK